MTRGPVIIIEGPDGAGKTTLARALQAHWTHTLDRGPIGYVHQGPYRGDPLPETIRRLERRENRGAVIADRLHLGEQVYGPVYRGRDKLGVAGRRMLERYLLARGAVVVLALPPFATAHAAWSTRKAAGGEMFPDEAGFRAVYDGFARSIRTHLPLRFYDHTAPEKPDDTIVEWIVDWIDGQLGCLRPEVGANDPKTLLVGEAPGSNQIPGAPPFTARGGCSEWLAEQLDAAGIAEAGLAWVNARDARDRTTRPDLLRRLYEAGQLRRTIALGKTAEAWCRANLGLIQTFVTTSHPQHHKRFHHHEPYALLEVLGERRHERAHANLRSI